ncbi:hypothetical protein BGW41_003428, partial [Actinomortierella wolfii]
MLKKDDKTVLKGSISSGPPAPTSHVAAKTSNKQSNKNDSTATTATTSSMSTVGGDESSLTAKLSAMQLSAKDLGLSHVDDLDINEMEDPLAGFEAQRSGLEDLSLK